MDLTASPAEVQKYLRSAANQLPLVRNLQDDVKQLDTYVQFKVTNTGAVGDIVQVRHLCHMMRCICTYILYE